MQNDVIRKREPFDRLTGLCAEMFDAVDRPENEDVRGVIFLEDGKLGGIQMSGYKDDTDAIIAVFTHLKAMFRSMGKDLELIAIPESPEGINATQLGGSDA